jgi:uncharacterized lipoprotein YehR (DUF1307 family)
MSENGRNVWGKIMTKEEVKKLLDRDIDNKVRPNLAPLNERINYYKALKFVLVDIIAHTTSTARNYPDLKVEELQQQAIDYLECYIDMRLKGYRGE